MGISTFLSIKILIKDIFINCEIYQIYTCQIYRFTRYIDFFIYNSYGLSNDCGKCISSEYPN